MQCRLCGSTKVKLKNLFDRDHSDVLNRLQTTFSILVCILHTQHFLYHREGNCVRTSITFRIEMPANVGTLMERYSFHSALQIFDVLQINCVRCILFELMGLFACRFTKEIHFHSACAKTVRIASIRITNKLFDLRNQKRSGLKLFEQEIRNTHIWTQEIDLT